jgi:membrane-associated phospholipid phosphatase
MRPYFYIEQGLINVPLVNDVQMHKQHSFPSGHSTTIFALATILSLHFKSYRTGIILFFISIFTAYSRVYLSQHFIQDVLAGSMFGVVFSSIIYIYLEKMKIKQLNNSPK